MGTMNDPGEFDCLEKLAKDEPFFILRAQDMLAPVVIRHWAGLAVRNGAPAEKVQEALAVAEAMERWPDRKAPD